MGTLHDGGQTTECGLAFKFSFRLQQSPHQITLGITAKQRSRCRVVCTICGVEHEPTGCPVKHGRLASLHLYFALNMLTHWLSACCLPCVSAPRSLPCCELTLLVCALCACHLQASHTCSCSSFHTASACSLKRSCTYTFLACRHSSSHKCSRRWE